MNVPDILGKLWADAGLPAEALGCAHLTGSEPVFPSSFAVGAAAQSTIAAAALAACELGHLRGAPRQQVAVDMTHAAVECTGWFSIDDVSPDPWDAFSGLYRCADGHVRVHANYAHHRDGALALLGLDPSKAQRADAEQALRDWRALDFEQAAAKRGLVVAALRSCDGAASDATPPMALPPLREGQRPLGGVRVLDLTRVLAGPVGGKALAAYGAQVMLVNSPTLPNISAIADTSRGKLSVHVDLRTDVGRAALQRLIGGAYVFVQGYHPGGLAALGFGAADLAELRPGIVCISLSAYGTQGPWADRRGFDSLLQTAMGFNHAEGEAAGDGKPRPMPMQILDEATGYLIAFGAAAALWRQQREGGSWHVQVSLAQTAQWLRSLGRVPNGPSAPRPELAPFLETSESGFGLLRAVRHSAQLSRTPALWRKPSMPPGSHSASWL